MKRKTRTLLVVVGILSLLSGCDKIHSIQNGGRYAAKWTCSCLFVQQREDASCAVDMMGGADALPRSIDYEQKSVTAGLPLMKGYSYYVEGAGCQLD